MNLRGHVTKFTQPLWSGENDVSSGGPFGPRIKHIGVEIHPKGGVNINGLLWPTKLF